MKRIVALLFLFCLAPLSAAAEATGPPARLVDAIAKQESDLNPLAINVAGKDYQPKTRQEAEAIILEALALGKSFDVGLMQVNSWWMNRYSIHPFSLLDPIVNRAWGEWILTQEIARHGFNWQAVGRYHSPDSERGRRYAWRVYALYTNGKAQPDFLRSQPNAYKAPTHENLSDRKGIRRDSGQRQPGRIITFDVQPESLPGVPGQKPGAPGGQTGTP